MNLSSLGIALIVGSVMLAGCAVENDHTDVGFGLAYHSNIKENADGSYLAAVEASALRGRKGGAQKLVTADALKKCDSLGKRMEVIKDETESHLWVNGVARLTFRCI